MFKKVAFTKRYNMYTKMAVRKDDSKAEIHLSDVGHSVVLSLLSIKIGIHFLLFFLSQDRPSTYQSKIKKPAYCISMCFSFPQGPSLFMNNTDQCQDEKTQYLVNDKSKFMSSLLNPRN